MRKIAVLLSNCQRGGALARKSRKKEEDVEAYRHETDTRKNTVSVGLASYNTSKPKPKKYEYYPQLDPQRSNLINHAKNQ